MVRIPQFQRQQLASSLVGTPGFDTSALRIGEAIAGAADVAAGVSAKLSFKRKVAADAAEATKRVTDFDLGLEEDFSAHKIEFRDDPADKTDQFRERAEERLNSVLDTIDSVDVRQNVSRQGQASIRSKSLRELNWSREQQIITAFNNLTSSVESLSQQALMAGRDQDIERMFELVEGLPNIFQTGGAILGGKEIQTLRTEAPKSVASGFLYGLNEENPDVALQLIKSGVFNDIFTPKELNKFRDDARSKVKQIDENLAFDELLAGAEANPELWGSYKSGELTLDKIDELPETDFTKTLRDFVLENTRSDVTTDSQIYVKLWDEANRLQSPKQRRKRKAKGTLEELLAFQDRVIKARKNNQINDSQVDTFLKPLSTPIMERVRKRTGKGKGGNLLESVVAGAPFPSPLHTAYKLITDWLDSQNRQTDNEAKATMLDKISDRAVEIGQRDPEKNLEKTMESITQDVIREQQFEDSPYSHIKVGDLWSSPLGPRKVTGFNPTTGRPEIEVTNQDIEDLRRKGFGV